MSALESELDGLLSEGTRVNGTLEFEKSVRIDGRFEGVVKSKGKLILGPSARVDAELEVGELEVQGRLKGKVNAKKRMMIRNGGVVDGDIVAGRLAIETGAVFRGRCEMPKPGAQPKAVPGGAEKTAPPPVTKAGATPKPAAVGKPAEPGRPTT